MSEQKRQSAAQEDAVILIPSLEPDDRLPAYVSELMANGGKTLPGVPTGFSALDDKTNGMGKGNLLILAARPGMGKTAFALSIAKNVAVDFHKPVAVFSLEMSGVDLAMRLISNVAEIAGERLKKGDMLSEAERTTMAAKVEALNDAPLCIATPSATMMMKFCLPSLRLASIFSTILSMSNSFSGQSTSTAPHATPVLTAI